MGLAGESQEVVVRGDDNDQLWALTPLTPESFVPEDHPIRALRRLADLALTRLAPTFRAMYSHTGRPSIPPERLLKAMLLMAIYSIRSERQLCERLHYDLLFKFFLGLQMAEAVFDHSTFSKNRQRLLEHDVSRQFFLAVREEAQKRQLLSAEHFTVDGTLLEAWASLKSVRPRDEEGGPPEGGGRNPDVDYRGERRRNQTHASTTDPEAQLMRKGAGKEAKLSFMGHVLMENRHGLVVDVELTRATGRAEREAALRMLDRQERRRQRITLGADKGYDSREFVAALRLRKITPHVAQNQSGRRSAIDGRTTASWGGYRLSQRVRKRVEEIFGWMKTVGGGRKLRFIGLARNRLWTEMMASAYNLVRVVRLERAGS
jgi:transposase